MTTILSAESPTALLVTQTPTLRHYWYPLARADALAEGPIARRLLGVDLVVWCPAPGQVIAAHDRCPHRDARLSAGWVEDCRLVCAYHGWQFGPEGRAVTIPQLDEGTPIPPRAALEQHRAEVRHGWVWVALDEPVMPIPVIPELDEGNRRVVHEPESIWSCSAPHLVDNNLDPSHVAYVHRASFGTPSRPQVPVAEAGRAPFGMWSSYDLEVESRPGEVGGTVRQTAKELHGPFLLVIRITYPDGVEHTMVKACTPVDDVTTRQLQIVIRNDGEAQRPAADIVAFDSQVWAEDKTVLETTWPDFRTDVTDNVHLKIDRASIEFRRLLADIATGAFPEAPPTG